MDITISLDRSIERSWGRGLKITVTVPRSQKIPPKIRVFSFVMLMCFLITYLAVIALEIVKSLGEMF